LDIFCDLKGATRTPRRAKQRHKAVTKRLLPAEELVPITMSVFACLAIVELDNLLFHRGYFATISTHPSRKLLDG
jgi:hypothetical protein